MGKTASAISLDDARLGTHGSSLKTALPSGVASEGRNATSRRVYDEATSFTDVAPQTTKTSLAQSA